jgi:primosomal protein N' (replication factor Y)
MAFLRACVQGIPIILASATPSVESYNHALKKKYEMIVLKQRFGDAKMPKMEIIDLNIVRRIKGGLLSEIARKELMDTIKSGNQAMIFLNRRGYAKMIRCGKCDFVFGCSNCSNKLTFHKKINMLKCHYCDFSMLKPSDCPQCHTPDSLGDFIPGVEQLKEEVEEFCGGLAKVSVFSSDEITGKDGIIKKIAEIQSQEFNVIIGTQIVSKGHNFPNLALVIVVGVDAVSNQNDPRIFEKLYQLLIQVAGRAGRTKNIEGKVLLQTMSPKHEVLQAIMEGDQDKFYAEEITRRKQSLLPPFLRQVNMIISAESDDIAKHNARTVSQALRLLLKTEKYNSKIGIAGPSESLIPYLKRKYRYTILLDSEKISLIRSLIRDALETVKIPAKVQVKIDIDPYNFS